MANKSKWTRRRIDDLLSIIGNAQMNVDGSSRIVSAIWEEWNPKAGVTEEEAGSLVEHLTDAKIQIDMAIEMLEGR